MAKPLFRGVVGSQPISRALVMSATRRTGQPAKNDPRALVICLLLKIWLGKPYRDLVSFLQDATYLGPIIGLRKLPGRMDLQRAMNRLAKAYLAPLNSFIVEQGYGGKKAARRNESAPLIAPASR